MCGLFGVYYKSATAKRLPKDAYALATYLTQLRGMHGMGVMYTFEKDDKVWLGLRKQGWDEDAKGKLPLGEFETPHEKVLGNYFNDIFNDKTIRSVAMHTRHATRGIKNTENTHPFREEFITLMHNGTLTNEYSINNKYFDVDSKALVHFLGQGGSVEELINKTKGAYALVWQDQRDGSLHFLRNKERPLVMAENDDLIIWASTPAVLGALDAQFSLSLRNKCELKPYQHVKVAIATNTFTRTQYEEPAIAKEVNRWGGFSYYNDDYDIYGDFHNKQEKKKETQPTTGQKPVIKLTASVTNPPADAKSLDSFPANTPAWFQQMVKISKVGSLTGSVYNVGRSIFLPSVHRRISYGLETLGESEVWKGLTFDLESVNTGGSIILSVHPYQSQNVRQYNAIQKTVTVIARPPIANGVYEHYDTVLVTLPEEMYREAVYNGLLVHARVNDSVNNAHLGLTLMTNATHTLFCFDPSVSGVIVPEEALIEDDIAKEMVNHGSC